MTDTDSLLAYYRQRCDDKDARLADLLAWARTPRGDRKAPHHAFTEGPHRELAREIELLEEARERPCLMLTAAWENKS